MRCLTYYYYFTTLLLLLLTTDTMTWYYCCTSTIILRTVCCIILRVMNERYLLTHKKDDTQSYKPDWNKSYTAGLGFQEVHYYQVILSIFILHNLEKFLFTSVCLSGCRASNNLEHCSCWLGFVLIGYFYFFFAKNTTTCKYVGRPFSPWETVQKQLLVRVRVLVAPEL